jgi:hypothetical protein
MVDTVDFVRVRVRVRCVCVVVFFRLDSDEISASRKVLATVYWLFVCESRFSRELLAQVADLFVSRKCHPKGRAIKHNQTVRG